MKYLGEACAVGAVICAFLAWAVGVIGGAVSRYRKTKEE